jgi:NtrC-family two-component system response regulator AlgB
MRVLIIDDEQNIRKTTAVALEEMGYETAGVEDGTTALRQLDKIVFDVAFLDLKLNGESGLDLIIDLLKCSPQLDIVVFTAFASVETAVEAMRRGAVDYIQKPFTPEQLRQVLNRIVKTRNLQGRLADLESRISSDSPSTELVSVEPAMQKVFELALKAADTPATMLILGESGTGKTVLARAIHDRSQQKSKTFVTVSCPSLSRELLESELFGHVKGAFTGAVGETWGKVALADGGTLFLDEIGELPLEVQPKLLRLLQDKEYERVGEAKTRRANVRVIAASNRDLEKAVQDSRFREDLFYRLNVISLHLPPLRERKGDLLSIARGFLRFFSAQCGKKIKRFSPLTEQALQHYGWPGNLRELRNVVERGAILANGEQIELADLPAKMDSSAAPGTEASATELGGRVTIEALENEAAQVLGIDPATLYRKRKKLGS